MGPKCSHSDRYKFADMYAFRVLLFFPGTFDTHVMTGKDAPEFDLFSTDASSRGGKLTVVFSTLAALPVRGLQVQVNAWRATSGAPPNDSKGTIV
ncbi:Aste57867_3719 [Aphanomyces stellatus]|uniref:Aste57867_3719 protein n=1 Tax=Aphanomyces stellatus TaxID=120398 RepID=A0A485KB51_9STRA|nr:hypothetical protein As57867_003708 [Aphanomyces stellatus]VFT80873.1 Aste57867_3719 [Aphanomyces stellatus]